MLYGSKHAAGYLSSGMGSTGRHQRIWDEWNIALVGNPNVGKSTLFNALTGANQHTGNWAGKTVSVAQGRYTYKGKRYALIDLPGTYSLLSQSEEERITVEFIKNKTADCILIVADATCMERSINLALQVLQLTDRAILCVNLLDEAEKNGQKIDLKLLERHLGIPVVGTTARSGDGLSELKETVRNLVEGFLSCSPLRVLTSDQSLFCDSSSKALGEKAEAIRNSVVQGEADRKARHPLDRIVLGKWSGRAVMLALLLLIFWITVVGANYPSALLQKFFAWIEHYLRSWTAPLPVWLSGLLLDGIYVTVSRVIAVMLPPMAIFFPLFTLLEDFGYLPRMAFLMDRSFQRCSSCGKQALTMSMGFGCNAVGVMGCRIISSPRERLLAILTNALVPCNGRFPTILTLVSLFFTESSLVAAILLTLFVLLCIGMTLLSSKILGVTALKGEASYFVLELPPYRKPQIGKILVRSIMDRTITVLGRAIMVAAPTGAFIWILQKLTIDSTPLLLWLANLLNPFAMFLGLNGAILLAFFLSFPANELLLPIVVLIMQGGVLTETAVPQLGEMLSQNGWTWKTALSVILFVMFHWPCGTTCLTIRKETASWKWTALAILLPTGIGILLCFLLNALLG